MRDWVDFLLLFAFIAACFVVGAGLSLLFLALT